MKVYINRKIAIGFTLTFIVVSTLGIRSYYYITEVIGIGRLGAASQQTIFLSECVRSRFGQLMVAQLESKEPVESRSTIDQELGSIRGLVIELDSLSINRPIQRANVRTLDSLLDDSFEGNPGGSFVRTGSRVKGGGNMNRLAEVNAVVDRIQAEEEGFLKEHGANSTRHFYQFVFTFFGLLGAGLVAPLILAYVLNSNLRRRDINEERLRQASASIDDLYQHAPCGYFSIDQEGMFSNANQTLLTWLGYTRTQVVDNLHFTNILPEGASIYHKEFLRMKNDGTAFHVETEIVRKDKSTIPVVIDATPIVNDRKEYVSSRCTVFDITDRKRAEDATRRANLELEAFSYSVSHDLRAPLRSVNGFAKVLQEDYGEKIDEEGNRIVAKIINSGNRMGRLIDDLLDFARIGKKELSKSLLAMNELVGTLSDELVGQEKGRKISVALKPLHNCIADPGMLRQVWLNLISNALKYSGKKEEIRIEISSEEGISEITYSIRDNGVGFDMQYMGKLFGVFQRLHKSEDFEGTGVGLALVKRVVERHNGRIWAEAAPNAGATFFFTIPRS